jgi:hypothetical protein
MNRVYDRKNTDLDSKLQIWLSFGPELIENKQIWNWWEWLKQQPNIPNMMIIYWKEQNQHKQNKFWKPTQNKPVTARQNPILERKEKAIQITWNLIYSIRIPRKEQISVYRSFYYV